MRLAKLLDTHPYSIPGVHLCTDDGDWTFISEGGSLAFFAQFEDLSQLSWSLSGLEFPLNPRMVKRVPIGFPGVQPAELRLDPAADLTDDSDTDAQPDPGDALDLIYIAGGRLGLWVMEAHPGSLYANRAARIDDSQDLNPLDQDSSRYCTGVDFVTLGSVDYLVASFAYARDSRLRFYPLSAARQVLTNAIALGQDGFGAELGAVHEVVLAAHPQAPPAANPATNPLAFAEPFALDIEVDPYLVGSQHAAHLYAAMGPHGIVRVTASALGAGAIQSVVDWGPMFGTLCPGGYDVAGPTSPNSGYPATRYENIDWVTTERDERFDDVTRSDTPQFLDLAVQDDANGHYLYAAVDHLAWLRFDLNDAWGDDIPIDYHEGEDVSVQDPARFPATNDVWFSVPGPVVEKETTWTPPLVRAVDSTPAAGPGAGRILMQFCREIEVTSVERAAGVFESVVVAHYTSRPWNFMCRGGRGPGLTYDNTLSRSGNVSAHAIINCLQGPPVVTFHWASDIVSTTPPVPGPSFDGYIVGGGTDIYVPPLHAKSERGEYGALKFVHGEMQTGLDASFVVKGSCISFFLLDDGTPAAPPGAGEWKNAPVFVRDFDAVGGRYAFGMGYSLVDPTILLTSFQEAGVGNDGVLHTPNLAAGTPADWQIEPLDGVQDDRGIVGLVFEQECQWVAPSSSIWSTALSNWTWGQISIPNSTNHWRIDELPYTPPVGNGPPSVDLGGRWTLNVPYDRWEHVMVVARPEHMGGTISQAYDAYTQQIASQSVPPLTAHTFVLASRGSTPDGVQLLARNQVESTVALSPSGGSLTFQDPRNPPAGAPWETCQFDTHPEWGNFEAPKYDVTDLNYPQPSTAWNQARAWWRDNGILPLQLWAGEPRTWPPELVQLSVDPGTAPRDRWVAVVPCGHASCPPQVGSYSTSIAAGGLGLPYIPPDFEASLLWESQYSRGFLQLFDVSDPWQLIQDAKVTVAQGGVPRDNFLPTASTMDPLFLPDDGSHAYRISTVVLGTASEHVLVFVADFGGRVHCFDITQAYAAVTGVPATPVATWEAAVSPLAGAPFDHAGHNIRALATDVIDDDEVMVYVGVSRIGILSIPFRVNVGFDQNAEHRIKTPGEVWGLEIRPATPATDRILLATDSYCGMRIYGLVDLSPPTKDDTSEEDA